MFLAHLWHHWWQKRARYRRVIKQHMDIGTIKSRIVSHSIKSAKELFRDLLLLANNALVFYSRRTREYKAAIALRKLVMKEYKKGLKRPVKLEAELGDDPPRKITTGKQRKIVRRWLCFIYRTESCVRGNNFFFFLLKVHTLYCFIFRFHAWDVVQLRRVGYGIRFFFKYYFVYFY